MMKPDYPHPLAYAASLFRCHLQVHGLNCAWKEDLPTPTRTPGVMPSKLMDTFVKRPEMLGITNQDQHITLGLTGQQTTEWRRDATLRSHDAWTVKLLDLLSTQGVPTIGTHQGLFDAERVGPVRAGKEIKQYLVGRRIGIGEGRVTFRARDMRNSDQLRTVELHVYVPADVSPPYGTIPVVGPRNVTIPVTVAYPDGRCVELHCDRDAIAARPHHAFELYEEAAGHGLYPEAVELFEYEGHWILVTDQVLGMNLRCHMLKNGYAELGWLAGIATALAESPFAGPHGNISPETIVAWVSPEGTAHMTLLDPGFTFGGANENRNRVITPAYNPLGLTGSAADAAGLAAILLEIVLGKLPSSEELVRGDRSILKKPDPLGLQLAQLAWGVLQSETPPSVGAFGHGLRQILERINA